MGKATTEKNKRKAKRLKQKEKALKRASSVIKRTGDQVLNAAETVDEMVKNAEARGRDQAYQMCANVVDEARTIGAARAKIHSLLEGDPDAEA